jgi:hypothetical protein
MPTIITIEFCRSWGFGSRFIAVRDALLAAVPNIQVRHETKWRPNSFEISIALDTAEKKLLYSKLEIDLLSSQPIWRDIAQGVAPDVDALVRRIRDYLGEKQQKIWQHRVRRLALSAWLIWRLTQNTVRCGQALIQIKYWVVS